MKKLFGIFAIAAAIFAGVAGPVFAQGYGTDTQNVLTPAAGGMAGVSLAQPQDVPAAIFGNPATLSQFQGTQFCLGGSWVEGYPTVTGPAIPDGVTSRTQGFAGPAVGVTQDLRSVGVPGALGIGLAGLSGLGAEYRDMAPGTFVNNLSSEYMVLGINLGMGVDLTDRLSVGAAMTLGMGFEQLGLTGPLISSAMIHDYALRGTFGLDYRLNDCNTVGAFYQTRMDFEFPNGIRIGPTNYYDLAVSQPETIGLGLANHSLCGGNLLLAADVYYKLWDDAPLWEDVFINQWAFAVGAQLTRDKLKYRLGYSYNTNPVNHNVGAQLEGFPIGQAAVQLFQATSCAAISQHRVTAGIGREGFLVPNLDLDLFAGGLFNAGDQFGASHASVAMYYVGVGLTWKFGAETASAE